MCLATSSSDRVNVYWLGEAILVFPDGPYGQREVALEVNGLARPNKAGDALTFAHRGEIYALEDRSGDWLVKDDWYADRVLGNPEVPGKSLRREGEDKAIIGFRQEFPPVEARIARTDENPISDIRVVSECETRRYTLKDMPTSATPDAKAIVSTFRLQFREPEMQLFRVRFRTRFGITDYQNQLEMRVEGPDSAMNSIRQEIAKRVSEPHRSELRREVDLFSDHLLEPPYDVAIIPHPSLVATIEGMQNAEVPVSAPVETNGTPIKSAACPSRSLFFDMKKRDFQVRVVAQVATRRVVYSPEFLTAVQEIGRPR